ncbi:MAG: DUF664 domain-containing protein [Alphaproteobacteria bacterium]|nr:DUF664 domain-containing protein [Alphaproteobacteria bacterium]
MARYNAWMNEKIYQAASGLSDKARKEDRGAFFGSLHGTLNHILWGDLIWLQRFATAEWDAPALEGLSFDPVSSKTIHKTEVFADFAALTAERAVIDAAIEEWADTNLTEDILTSDLNFWHTFRNKDMTLPMGLCVSHLFNHQTHHRGQATTLLSQMGVDAGATDMIAMPRED